MQPERPAPSTPEAVAAEAQTRRGGTPAATSRQPASVAAEERAYEIGPGVIRATRTHPYERRPKDPIYRPLRIYTLDPTAPRLEGAVNVVNVPYEPLEPGPVGYLLEVAGCASQNAAAPRVDLEDRRILLLSGRDPSPSDPEFQQQMVYAVASSVCFTFQKALGRHIAWGFDRGTWPSAKATRLILRPRAGEERNAYYDKQRGEIRFGYFKAEKVVAGPNIPGGTIYTCLSHDIIVHEMTHALLDGLRARFVDPSGPDVLAFHEGFADLVAILQRFSYRSVVLTAMRKAHGRLMDAALLTDIARQFGQTTGSEGALRTAIDVKEASETPVPYDDRLEPHELGMVLVRAVFEAFMTVYQRRTERFLRLATGGSGVLAPGALSTDLQEILAGEASKVASQFLNICIRAIDYCPPIDLELGEFLRAVITADFDLVPDDPWDYRGAWIDAFWRRRIYPRGVENLSVDELLWQPPQAKIPNATELSFASLKFEGDPGRAAGAEELCRQARALGRLVTHPNYLAEFGLARPRTHAGKDVIERPRVESIRASRRVGPNGQIVFDLVAEVIQRRRVRTADGSLALGFFGGATVILGPEGEVRYVIRKRITDEARLQRQRTFMASAKGRRYWQLEDETYRPGRQLFRLVHQRRSS
jgi:hypothetical protein